MADVRPPTPGGNRQPAQLSPEVVTHKHHEEDLSVIDLEPAESADHPAMTSEVVPGVSKIKAFGGAAAPHAQRKWKRPSNLSGAGAVRVRTFHGRLSDEGTAFVDEKINEWLDEHPEIEVKFATTTIGVFEGKIKDLALVINVWY